MVGYIKLHRKIQGWEWYKDSYMVHLLIHLVMSAYYEDSNYRGVKYKRGQLTTGRKKLSLETGISEQKIRTGLKRLEISGELTTKITSKFTIITICNYEEYQGQKEEVNQHINQQVTSNQPAINQQLTTVKEVKKLKEVKKTTTAIRPDNFPEDEWGYLLTHRKSKKAPLTGIALKGLLKEFDKSGLTYGECVSEMANRGWTGFKAEWVGGNKKTETSEWA